jgi:hypothetical protein
MPTKTPVKKASSTKKRVVPAKKTTTKKVVSKKKLLHEKLLDHIKGSITKKGLIVSALAVVVLGAGVGGYALFQNMSANAAGGFTSLGTVSAVYSPKQRLAATLYACKVSVPRHGYALRAKAVISASSYTNAGDFKFTLYVGGDGSAASQSSTVTPGVGTVYTTGTTGPVSHGNATVTLGNYGNIYGSMNRSKTVKIASITNC